MDRQVCTFNHYPFVIRELSVRIASHKRAIKVGCLPRVSLPGDLNAEQWFPDIQQPLPSAG